MASQQGAPSRPWFRLATMVRPPPAPAASPPQPDQGPPPRPAFIRPAFSQAIRAPPAAPSPQPTLTQPNAPPSLPATDVVAPPSRPTPPQPPVAEATPAPASSTTVLQEPLPRPSPPSDSRTLPLQQSAPPSAVSSSTPPPPPSRSIVPSLTIAVDPTTTRVATPTSSPPKTVKPLEKSPSPSTTIKPISNPPSPLTLPSPQLKSYNRNQPEYEQKNVLVQETKEKPKGVDNDFNGDLRRHMGWSAHSPKRDTTKNPETSKMHYNSEDVGTRIITIAGENKGAIMELSSFGNKTHKFGNNPQSLQIKKDNPTATSDGEKSGTDLDGRSKAKNKNQKSNSQLMTAVMNSNVQGVNNSMIYNCSTTHHDPGVHFSLSRKPSAGHGFYLKDYNDKIH